MPTSYWAAINKRGNQAIIIHRPIVISLAPPIILTHASKMEQPEPFKIFARLYLASIIEREMQYEIPFISIDYRLNYDTDMFRSLV
ncbi:hypothetical protein SAMN04490183_1217 [Pseudomonas corrugata]|nr:hypothetical protein SAMN04490183_1217 [Pseudomonas corrugata]